MCLHLVYTGHVRRATSTLQKLREKDGLQLKYQRDLSNLNSAINVLYTLQQFTFAPSAKQERVFLPHNMPMDICTPLSTKVSISVCCYCKRNTKDNQCCAMQCNRLLSKVTPKSRQKSHLNRNTFLFMKDHSADLIKHLQLFRFDLNL